MENIYIQKLETILFSINFGLQELSENIQHAKKVGHKGRFVLKLHLGENYENNTNFTGFDLETDLLTIQQTVKNIAEHLETIVFDEIDGFQKEIDQVFDLI